MLPALSGFGKKKSIFSGTVRYIRGESLKSRDKNSYEINLIEIIKIVYPPKSHKNVFEIADKKFIEQVESKFIGKNKKHLYNKAKNEEI